MLDKCLQIVYSNPQAVYCPGANVEGVVHLDLKESFKARSLKVAIHGQAYTQWNVRRRVPVRRPDGTLWIYSLYDQNGIGSSMAIRQNEHASLYCVTSLKGDLYPGEAIVVNALINNDSSKNLVKAKMELLEISKYVGHKISGMYDREPSNLLERCDNTREQRRILATREQDIFVRNKSNGTVQLHLQVPPTVPSFNCCPIISVEHILEIKIRSLVTFGGDIESCFPVILGTIPVHNRNIFAQPTAPMQYMPSTSSVAPTAPTVRTALPLGTAPSYSARSETNGHLPPPSSYEKSVNGVDGTTMDRNNIEPFVPRYPFYPNMAPQQRPGGSLNH